MMLRKYMMLKRCSKWLRVWKQEVSKLITNGQTSVQKNADSASKKIFETLVGDEERHYDQYDKEMENLMKFGDNYLALQSIERSKTIAAGRPTE